jgi:hypothetical protein
MPDPIIPVPLGAHVDWCLRVLTVSKQGAVTPIKAIPLQTLKACVKAARFEVAVDHGAFCDIHFRVKGAKEWVRHCGFTPTEKAGGEHVYANKVPPGSFLTDSAYLWEVVLACDVVEKADYPNQPLVRVYRVMPPPPGITRTQVLKMQGDVFNASHAGFLYVGSREKADAVLAESERVARTEKDRAADTVRSAGKSAMLIAALAGLSMLPRPEAPQR